MFRVAERTKWAILWETMFVAFVSFVVITTLYSAATFLETRFWPVSSQGQIEKVERHGRWLHIWGRAEKRRDCVYERLSWYRGVRNDRAVGVLVEPLERNKIRSPGTFGFGPWRILVDEPYGIKDTYGDVYHQCYFFGLKLPWYTFTEFYN